MTLDLGPMKTSPTWRRILPLMALGLVVGLPAGYLTGKLLRHGGRLPSLTASDVVSLAIAGTLTLLGLIVVAFSATRRGMARLTDPHAEDPYAPVRQGQRGYFRAQGAVMALAGLMMATPVVIVVGYPEVGEALAPVVMLGLIAAFLLQTALNLMIWTRSDELVRRAIADTGAVCFWLLQGALFLWAAGEKLGLLPHLSSWDALTVLMGFYLIMSVVVSYRRGLS